jgi:hypothetical protein
MTMFVVKADPADWKLGLYYAAATLDAVGLTWIGDNLREAPTPAEGAKEAENAGRCCLAASVVGRHLADELQAEAEADTVADDWKRQQRKDWAFGAASIPMRMWRPRDACMWAADLCWRASMIRDIVLAAEEAAEAA